MNAPASEDAVVNLSGDQAGAESRKLANTGYDQNLVVAKQIAKDNPRMVASVVTNWTNGNE
jgi:flagellar M-ring protein FliF